MEGYKQLFNKQLWLVACCNYKSDTELRLKQHIEQQNTISSINENTNLMQQSFKCLFHRDRPLYMFRVSHPPIIRSFKHVQYLLIYDARNRKNETISSMGPCIANVFPSINNKMQHYTIYFCETLYMFQAVPPPIVGSSKLYIQHRVLCQTFTATCHCRGRDGTH